MYRIITRSGETVYEEGTSIPSALYKADIPLSDLHMIKKLDAEEEEIVRDVMNKKYED